ncbi:2-hydroxyacid dehydrogenase [Aestuariibius sp. HNIBRBA575]|uniref:2-hydroxyacid dehydrogenase n=1 Tax=Aestuariibius sp. HNIBRBA575 TaxID=3233343 RepID=UPI0034A17B85
MKLLITRDLPNKVLNAAREKFDVTYRQEPTGLTPQEATWALQDFDAVLPTLGDAFSAQVFGNADKIRCKVLANFGVGYNHIDIEAARKAGVKVTNTPDAVTNATADIGMTLLLSVARRAGEGERIVRAGQWHGWAPTQMLGTHVTGKTVGIVGMGRIGQAVARRCHYGFDMPVLFYNRSKKHSNVPAKQVKTLTDLMAQSDFVVVTVPGGAQTHHLIDAQAIAAMKSTGFLINIARGDVIDEEVLIAALQTGQIAGAGLDVYAQEPHVPEALRALENAVLLPHLGTAAMDVREEMGMMALGNVIAMSEGRPLPQDLG